MSRPRAKTAPGSSQAVSGPIQAQGLNIIELMQSPHLFGLMFKAPSWRPWFAFLRALFGLAMDEEDLAIYRHHTGRQNPPARLQRYAELVIGRRGGKSRVLALIAVFLACMLDHSDYLTAGELPVIAIIAADRKQAKVIFNYIAGFLRAVPSLNGLIEDELAETIRLKNGVQIEVFSGSVASPRGRTFLAVLLDETAFWQTGDSANPDFEVLNAVRPGLTTIPYSLLIIASSPYAKRGLLYFNFAKYYGVENAPCLVWQGTTEEMNASLVDDPLIAEMYQEDPERASAEFGAQFRSDIVAFITREAVEEVVPRGVRELPPSRGLSYVAFVDPSGGSADSMTLAIAHVEADGITFLDAVREVKPPFSPDDVVTEFSELMKSYGISTVHGDAYAGQWPRERFAINGIGYEVSDRNKSIIYNDFLPALNAKRVMLLDNQRLIGQLVALERRTSRGGRDSIDHAPGAHDDLANAVAGALTHALNERRPALIARSDMLIGNATVPWPSIADLVYGTFTSDKAGNCACVFLAKIPGERSFVLLDFIAGPQSSGSIGDCIEFLKNLRTKMRVRYAIECFFPESLLIPVRQGGYEFARAIPDGLLSDPQSTALNAATWIARPGSVLISDIADQHAKVSPLGGALSIRSGEDMSNALRAAFLVSVNIGLVR